MAEPRPLDEMRLTLARAYGRVWVGCPHGGNPDGITVMCLDCFRRTVNEQKYRFVNIPREVGDENG